jgi:hypothetical protein
MTMFIRSCNLLIVFSLFFSLNVFSADVQSESNVIKDFQKSQGKNATCNADNITKTLVLIDKTDPLTDAQKAFVKASFIDNYEWNHLGDTFGIAVLNGSGVSLMKTETICAPMPLSKNNGLANRARVNHFKEALQQAFSSLTIAEPKANNSNLYEAIVEVYRNPTFKFSPSNEGRVLIIVSDLFQNSSNINFYSKCANGCPSYESSLKSDPNMKNYLDMANLKLSNNDTIKIYHLQSKCKIAGSLDKWWEGAFKSAGLSSSNLLIQHELAGDCPK